MIEYECKKIKPRDAIRWRLLGTIFALLLGLTIVLTTVQLIFQQATLERQQQQYAQLMREKLNAQAILLIENLSFVVANHLENNDFHIARELIESVVRQNDGLDFAILMRLNRKIMIHTHQPALEQTVADDAVTTFALQQKTRNNQMYLIKGEQFLEFVMPVLVMKKPWGVLRLGLSMQPMLEQIQQAKEQIREEMLAIITRTILMAFIFLVFGGWITLKIAANITNPIGFLVSQVKRLSSGEYKADIDIKRLNYDEITLLSDAFCHMASNITKSHQQLEEYSHNLEKMVAERTAKLEDAMKKLDEMASTDQLTGIYNRRKFDELFPNERNKQLQEKKQLSLIILDIDHFKRVNDTYGHNVGDEVLKTISEVIKQHIRCHDTLFRWGGEEFIILASGADVNAATVVAEKIREAVAAYDFDTVGQVTISLGVTEYHYEEGIDDCVSRADTGLYQAKEGGRNCVVRL